MNTSRLVNGDSPGATIRAMYRKVERAPKARRAVAATTSDPIPRAITTRAIPSRYRTGTGARATGGEGE
jgi:hypothetical protein